MNYAVVRIKGKQYKVSEGDEVLVDKITGKPEADVLLVVADKKVKVGQPILKDAKVALKALADEKGEKLYVQKYKSKSRYRKKMGFRHAYTRLQVGKITTK